MKPPKHDPHRIVDGSFIGSVTRALSEGRRVRRSVDGMGRLHLERLLPFLLVVRRGEDEVMEGIDSLVTAESSILVASSAPGDQRSITQLVESIGALAKEAFGTFLVIEFWPADSTRVGPKVADSDRIPGFHVLSRRGAGSGRIADLIADELAGVLVQGKRAQVTVGHRSRLAPEGATGILGPAALKRIGGHSIGVEVKPIHLGEGDAETFPAILRALRRSFSRSIRRALFAFLKSESTHRPEHFHVLGRRAIVKTVWQVDGKLAAVAGQFDWLLNVTPSNSQEAWLAFRRDPGAVPRLRYRPVPFDPLALKRELYSIPVERIEDPALSHLFRQKQLELDRQLTMLADRNTSRFLPGSQALYGPISAKVVNTARNILQALPPSERVEPSGGRITAEAFYERGMKELHSYANAWPGYEPSIEIRDDIASGLMVSRGVLWIAANTHIPARRVEALIHHEIGTHVLTYHNAAAQPFQQLRVGLAGYDALQEGLAVFAEYLVGGLTKSRMRILAGRVLAVDALTRGRDFIEIHELLVEAYGFDSKTAFSMALRVCRGGGLTKDAFYLKGLMDVLRHLSTGGRFRPLFVGKIATTDISVIEELQWRGVLVEPPALPNYLSDPSALPRLERARAGLTPLDLLPR